ncbi:hypothetical protein VCRA217O317_220007 [Vibrio crassostreae]|nr:hypothetical protein VCRA217O317_220007 [Vibrio crassostreae]
MLKATIRSSKFTHILRSMPKPRYRTTNWKQYNQALINRGSLTFWIDEEAIQQWKQLKQGKRAKMVNVSFKTKTRGAIQHLVIDATGLKVYGEGE